jgi:ParB family chromosome partitioning protein
MSKKRGLGRGLGALIPTEIPEEELAEQEVGSSSPGLRLVNPAEIDPNPHQPRTEFDEHQLQELADSILTHGLIQPLIVTAGANGRFTLIAGERRWRASKLANLAEVPVVVKEASPQAMLELALIENIQRADLNPLEEALAYQQLIQEFGLTHEAVAKSVGKARPTVTNMVRLLDLPPVVQEALLMGKISGRHARELLRLDSSDDQTAVLKSIVELELNVRQTEILVAKMLSKVKPTPQPTRRMPAELVALQDSFRQKLGTRVDVQKSGKGGKVVIHFYSDEELNAIYENILGEEG